MGDLLATNHVSENVLVIVRDELGVGAGGFRFGDGVQQGLADGQILAGFHSGLLLGHAVDGFGLNSTQLLVESGVVADVFAEDPLSIVFVLETLAAARRP